MADISILLRIINGVARNVDISANTLVTTSVKVGGGVSNTELTKAILDNLITLQNGSDIAASLHHHDGRYFTEAELGSSTASSGSDLIGDDDTYSNFTPSAATIKGALAGIDAALATAGGTAFSDSLFRIQDNTDATKQIAFEASGITTATTRTITVPDADVNLGALTNSNIAAAAGISLDKLAALTASRAVATNASGFLVASASTDVELGYLSGVTSAIQTQLNSKAADADVIKKNGSVAFTGNQSMGGFTLYNLATPAGADEAATKGYADNLFANAITKDGTTAFTGDQSMGGFKLTNVATPAASTDAANKSYVDSVAEGMRPKEAVRVATTENITLSGTQTIDGVSVVAGNRILVKDQTSTAANGIYVVAAGAWSRSTDFDSLSPIDEINRSLVAVQEGTANAGKIFVQTGAVVTLDTDPINFVFYNSNAALVGGDGITVSGSNISVHHDGEGLAFSTGQLVLELDGATLTKSVLGLKISTGGVTDTEIAALAGIQYSKLNLLNSIVDADIFAGAAISYTKLSLGNSIINSDISTVAGIEYSKLSLANSILNADIATGAAIAYSKLALSNSIVDADISSIAAISYSKLALNNSIVNNDIATGAAIDYAKLALTGSIVNADISGTAAIAYSKLNLANSIVTADLTNASVDETKLASSVAGNGLTGGAGTALAVGANADGSIVVNANDIQVAHAPAIKKTFTAGETFAANTTFAVRIALTGETAGYVYKADYDASVSDKFYAYGVVEGNGAAQVTSGNPIVVVMLGEVTLGSSDTAFAGAEVGQPVHLLSAGGFDVVSQISYTTNQASYRIGIAQDINKILVGNMQLLGIN